MALHVLDGELTTFFWGQAFGGSQEAILTAPLFWVVRAGLDRACASSPSCSPPPPRLVVWRVGRRTIGEPAAIVAGVPRLALAAVPRPPPHAPVRVLRGRAPLLRPPAPRRSPARRAAEPGPRRRASGSCSGSRCGRARRCCPIAVGVVAWTLWKQPSLAPPRLDRRAARRGGRAAVDRLERPARLGLARVDDREHDLVRPPAADLRSPPSSACCSVCARRTRRSRSCRSIATFLVLRRAGSALRLRRLPGARPRGVAPLRRRGGLSVRLRARPADALQPGAALPPRAEPGRRPPRRAARRRRTGAGSPCSASRSRSRSRPSTAWRRTWRRPSSAAEGSPRPRPAVATLDDLGLDRVYADFWLSYRLTFDTDERIVAAQSKLERVGLVNGEALAARHPFSRHRPYEREVEAARVRGSSSSASRSRGRRPRARSARRRRVRQLARLTHALESAGYRGVAVGPFVVYAPPVERADG